ncbi:MAG: flavodoxin domain-containing protein [Lachnospiraceae bacterium]|nr:flavodoxin domain-containing protein [Lachnospiraceae bacterium]
MKVLIVYATRGGAAAKAAAFLASHFEKVIVRNLGRSMPDPTSYDLVIFGSGTHFGKIYIELEEWLDRYWKVLKKKPKAVFICNVFQEEETAILKSNFSEGMMKNAAAVGAFGGEFHSEKLTRKDKMLLRVKKKELLSPGLKELMPCLLTWKMERFLADIDCFMDEWMKNMGIRRDVREEDW